MSALFLRGQQSRLLSGDEAPRHRLEDPFWLAPGRTLAPDDIWLLVGDAGGALHGAIGLCDVDWLVGEADLVAWGSPPPEVAAEAVALMVKYAFDELNLDRIIALPMTGSAEAALRGAEFQTTDVRRWSIGRELRQPQTQA